MSKFICKLEVLSPVHIGSGVKLKYGFDFFTTNDSTYIVPQSVLIDYLRDNPEDIEKFNDLSFRPMSLRTKISENDCQHYSISCDSEDLHEFERDGFGNPYIPGSSIKGAIRTALLKSNINKRHAEISEIFTSISQDNRVRKEWAGDKIAQKIFGKDSNHNEMRILSFGDAQFSQNDMELAHIKILNLSNREGTKWTWKKAGQNDMEVYAETLAMGTQGLVTLRIDDFLSNNMIAKEKLNFKPISIEGLFSEINSYSRQAIEKEILFFENFPDSRLKEVLADLSEIQQLIPLQNTPEEKTECVFRLGWGIGWKSMTGDWMNDSEMSIMRGKFNIGSRDFPIFPKTRKIVMDGDPRTVTGWVRLAL